MWKGFALLLAITLFGVCLALPATPTKPKSDKSSEKCVFSDESYEMEVIHVFVCPNVNVTFEKKSTRNHAVITIEPRSEGGEEKEEESAVMRLIELPKKAKNWDKLESYQVFFYNVEFEGEPEAVVNVLNEMGIDSNKVAHLEVSNCPGFGLVHLQGMKQLWSLTVEGTLEGVDSDNHLDSVVPQTRSLMLHSIELDALPSLKGLKYLEEFSIECNLCTEIPEKYFAENKMLSFIHIDAPEMNKVSKDLCHNLQKLESLYLTTNLADLPPLKDCQAMREFIIYNSDMSNVTRTMKRVSPDLTGLKQLRTLMLQNSGIDSVPVATIKANPHLYDINLSHNHIKEVPSGAFAHLGDLQALDISENNITRLSDSILPESIIYLNARETLIREFIPTKPLPNLYALELSDNQLTGVFRLKPFIQNYHALYLCDVSGNELTSVELSGPFFAKENSIDVDFSYNRITTVKVDPSTVGTMASDDEARINLDLGGNVLKCDCQLKPFVEALRKVDSNIYLKYDVKCSEPKGKTVKTIELSEMKC